MDTNEAVTEAEMRQLERLLALAQDENLLSVAENIRRAHAMAAVLAPRMMAEIRAVRGFRDPSP